MKKLKRLKRLSLLALMVVGVQGTWGQTDLSFNCSSDNSSDISSNAGNNCNVTLSGRNLYRDGDWNTLCLPFGVTAEQIAEATHPLYGATIKELLTTSNLDNYGTLTLNFNTVGAIVAGKPYIVRWDNYFTIKTQDDWNTFAENVEQYDGKIVQLATDDIIVTAGTMVTSDNPFKGTFDGGGHTITCNIDNAGTAGDVSYIGTAPFSYIQDATIKNLKVTGTVKGGNHCAGLVGLAAGTNTITNCEVDVYVDCQATGNDTHCGGILGNGTTSATTISNCLFSGSITGSTSTAGIIYGWGAIGGTQNIDHCLANAEYTYANSLDMIKGVGTISALDCYKNTGSGDYGTEVDVNFGTDKSATSTYVTNLGATNWELVEYVEDETTKYKVVPVMATINNTIDNPVFSGVTIANTNIPTDVSFTGGTFKGNYAPLTISDDNRDKILLLTSGNKLGYAKDGAKPTLNAFRAYFEIPTGQTVRSFVLNFGDGEDTGITTTYFTDHTASDAWHSLDGRRLNRQPTVAGLYIHNGRKVIIK